MFFTSILVTICRTLQEYLLNATGTLPTGVPPLNAGNVHLMHSYTVAPNIDSIPADFTECTFTGYVPFSVAYGGPQNLLGEGGMGIVCVAYFQATSPFTSGPQQAVGYWVDDNAGHVVMAEIFTEPFNFVKAFDQLQVSSILPLITAQPSGQSPS